MELWKLSGTDIAIGTPSLQIEQDLEEEVPKLNLPEVRVPSAARVEALESCVERLEREILVLRADLATVRWELSRKAWSWKELWTRIRARLEGWFAKSE